MKSSCVKFPRWAGMPLMLLCLLGMGMIQSVQAVETVPPPVVHPQYGYPDWPVLMKMDRATVFATLRSFDDRGMADDAFVRQAILLLDETRIPGLAEARAADDPQRMLDMVYQACKRLNPPPVTPELTEEARALADDALRNRFSCFGEAYQLPEKIDWFTNPGTESWGHFFNRFTFLVPLTQAYLATGDTRYSRKAKELILAWITDVDFTRAFAMPPGGGDAPFGSYLTQAIHARQWAVCVSQLLATNQLSPIELLHILKSLHDHLAYLELCTHKHAGNWPTIGCMGMVGTLEMLPVFRDTQRFAIYGRATLEEQLADQVLPDGVQDELSTTYHMVVLENMLRCTAALRKLGYPFDPTVMETVRKMVHYAQQTELPNGTHRVALNDADPAFEISTLTDSLRQDALTALLSPADHLTSELFPYAGVAILRQKPAEGDLYLAFDGGPFGRNHMHEDKLSFSLYAYGRSFIVDPGRHLYDYSAVSYFDYLRSTRGHSTIIINGMEQCRYNQRWTWKPKARADMAWSEHPGDVRASGIYYEGYGAFTQKTVQHSREIVFVRERCWVIFDTVLGNAENIIESRFVFAPGTVTWNGTAATTAFPDANLLLLPRATVPLQRAQVECGQEYPRSGWYSDSYNTIEPAPVLSLVLRGKLPVRIATLLYPYRGANAPPVAFTFDGTVATISTPELGEIRVACTEK